MMTTTEMLVYLERHDLSSLPQTDPALTQAIVDGFASWDGKEWVLVGRIKPGERRRVRFSDGTTRWEVGRC